MVRKVFRAQAALGGTDELGVVCGGGRAVEFLDDAPLGIGRCHHHAPADGCEVLSLEWCERQRCGNQHQDRAVLVERAVCVDVGVCELQAVPRRSTDQRDLSKYTLQRGGNQFLVHRQAVDQEKREGVAGVTAGFEALQLLEQNLLERVG